MKDTIHLCPDCGSAEVEVLEWRNVNTGLIGGGDPVNYHCNDCDENKKGLASSEEEISGSVTQLVTDLAKSGLFEFILEGHEIPEEIRAEWEDLRVRMSILAGA